ncbi:hypothetical protein LZZ90_13880 [Flavobacterium sp. SM15]|uniref:hypothetical protein n=1 Tax=Flavobacterium sp. SM15 TaxID=2908005 RepID=UPI001EDB8D00|nr:hypothetical protein [Flavobacterium sp. SM15]MCG2612595.1 hypothetical protein [Flavobacterium sp. SM15]
MENRNLEFTIRRGILDNAPRKLILNPEYLKFENNDSITNLNTTFHKDEISEFRFGMKWISLEVTFGREYFIYIKNKENNVLKINFRTYFGNKKTEYQNLYREIIINLEKLYFGDIIDKYLKMFAENENFQIGEVKFSKENILMKVKGTEKVISWDKVRFKEYYTYLAIYSSENPESINRGFYYLEDWNTLVLHSVLKSILKHKEL